MSNNKEFTDWYNKAKDAIPIDIGEGLLRAALDCLGFLQHLAAEENLAPFLEANPGVVQGIVGVCRRAGVGSVVASDQYGMMFLLSEGPDQAGGIVYRNDALEYQALKALAGRVNKALRQDPIPEPPPITLGQL